MKAQAVIEKRDEYYAYGSVLEAVSRGLYPDRKHILREFVQNAYDAIDDLRQIKPGEPLEPIQIMAKPPSLIIADKGIGMSEETMKRYRYLGFSEKKIGSHAGFRGIGKFSAISACDRLIVSSSKLGDPKKYQVVIDAKGIFDRLQKEKNPPLDRILQEHSQIDSTDEKPEEHYTVVELNGIRKDAAELLDERIINPYLIRTVPLQFDPTFAPGKEVSARLRQVDSRFLEVELLINGKPIYKPFLANASRPEYIEIFTRKGANLIAYAWFCQNRDKGQFPKEDDDDETKARKHPHSGLHYRMSNFAVGDSLLLRKTIWLTSPERAFHFFGEIHVLDAGVIPTSDRDDFEDNSARGQLYERCGDLVVRLNYRAELNSQKHRFREVVEKGEEFVAEKEQEIKEQKLEYELKDETDYRVQKLLEDVEKRLDRSSRQKDKEVAVVRRARRLVRRASRLHSILKSGNGNSGLVDIGKELKMDAKTKAIYEAIIGVLKQEFRSETQRFAAVVRAIHKALREGIPC